MILIAKSPAVELVVRKNNEVIKLKVLKYKVKNKKNNIILEIGIIVVVLGFLGWITWGQFSLAGARSRDVERKTSLHEVSKVVRLFYKDYGELPTEELLNSLWGKEWKDGDYTYMMTVPKENYLENKEYCYKVSDDGLVFYLFADLENKKDQDCSSDLWECGDNYYCYRDELEVTEEIN